MNDKFKLLISEALEMDVADVNDGLALDPEENWDSIALLSVISAIDTQYGIQLDGEELAACRLVSEVYGMINKN
tara:strand:+ start:240 stop:461 length:222 start_codon:yes stop_codon:yes gene_type:complete